MRVLHVVNSTRGGATMSLLSLMRTSVRLGSDLEHFVVYPGRFGDRSPVFQGLARDCCAMPLIPWNTPRLPWTLRGQAARLRAHAEKLRGPSTFRAFDSLAKRWKIDLIHTNTAIIREGADYALQAGVPHVWHIRERLGKDGFMHFAASDGEVARTIADRSAVIPVISEYVREFFESNGQGAKTRLVYDGVDLEYFNDPSADDRGRALRVRLGIPEGAFLVGMVGGLATTVKRHGVFLEAAARVRAAVPESWFLIVGAVPSEGKFFRRPTDAYVRSIKALIERLKLTDRVVFLGFSDDMPAVWHAMDVYVHACEVEGFSRAILEAMASGVPVVAAANGGATEAVRDGDTGLTFSGGSTESCARCTLMIRRNRRLRGTLTSRASASVKGSFESVLDHQRMVRVFQTPYSGYAEPAVVTPGSSHGRDASGPGVHTHAPRGEGV